MQAKRSLDDTIISAPGDLGIGDQWAFLRLLAGTDQGRIMPLGPGRTSFGRRPDNDVVLHDEGVSREQFVIDWSPTSYALLRDLGSSNGTLVDGELIRADSIVLHNGSTIQIGSDVILKFAFMDGLEARAGREIYEAAVRDELTQLYNKRYFQERIAHEFFTARRADKPLSLVVFDIDRFKRVNDDHGHDVGDAVLRQVSAGIASSKRVEDVLARYGGEEFVLLMRDCALPHALEVAERIRARVEENGFERDTTTIKTTLSAGVACTLETPCDDPWALFQHADEALYAAKAAGRNRVEFAA